MAEASSIDAGMEQERLARPITSRPAGATPAPATTAPTETARGSDGCASPVAEPPSPSAAASPDWLTPMIAWAREAAAERRETIPSQEPVFGAYGTATAALRIAFARLEAGEPFEQLRDVLVRGLLGAEALMGDVHLTCAIAVIRQHETLKAQIAAGHYLVPGDFWQGHVYRNRCACGRRFERMGAPCMSDAEQHVRVMQLPNVNSSECDCRGNRDAIPVWDGRCGGCGAVLYGSALAGRKGAA